MTLSFFNLSGGKAAEARRAIGAQKRLATATATGLVLLSGGGDPFWGAIATATAFQTQFAAASDMQAATATALSVTPEVWAQHPNAIKAWAMFSGTVTGTQVPTIGNGISQVERTGAGEYTITFTTPFTSSEYGFHVTTRQDVGTLLFFPGENATGSQLASSFDLITVNSAGAAADPSKITVSFLGEQ